MPSPHACSAAFRYLIGHRKSVVAFLILLGIATTCLAGTFIAFGPTSYTRPSGSPVTVTNTFSVLNPATQYTLKAFNGGMQNDQTELVSQTVVTLNGVQVINSTNFNSSVAEVDVPVSLQATNTLTVELRGKPGGVLTIEVVGVDNDPPTIKATPSPLPNAAAWNNTSVTVAFTCNDATSGVASCPAPQTVMTEGSTVISGTATDNAGNTASTSITVNIDKTAPTIAASASPAANSSSWNSSNVTVTFSCADSLSGVATCTPPATVSTEGSNQVIAGTAVDVAGNVSSASATINLDKTPPAISITSPADGSTSSASSISVTGSVSDSLSGVSSVTCNGIAAAVQAGTFTCSVNLAVGSNPILALATDVAGNTSSSSINVIRNSPLSITSLNPTSAPVGTSVVITGTNFGSAQGSSTVTFNGTSAIPTSWSDTQIVVPVPSGATTGPVVVTVAGQASNQLTFGVGTPPTISATVSPAPNPNGWINSNATVTFTCTAGSAAIATCPTSQIITSEGANQAVSGTATDTDGTTASTTVTLNIDKTKPVLVVASPADGSAASSSTQTVTGSAGDSLSGLSSLTCNGTNVPLSAGSFSCNISLSVGVNLIVVRATDLAGNIAGSNFHVSLSGTLPAPQSVQITPASANLLVGGTQAFTAVDELGRPRSDTTWAVSDTTIATISTDSSPLLTGVAVGQVTLTATVQSASVQIQVNILGGASLPAGSTIWSAPTLTGFTDWQIIQAEPVQGGPDLYSIATNPDTKDTVVRALSGDGQQQWSQTFPGTRLSAIADGNGGTLLTYYSPSGSYTRVVDLDAQTGAPVWENDSTFLSGSASNFAAAESVAPDGTILVQSYTTLALDPNTGAATRLQPANTPEGFLTYWDYCGGPIHTVPYPYAVASQDGIGASVAADGTIFQVVSSLDLTFLTNCSSDPTSISEKLYLSRTAPDGSATFTAFDTETSLVPDSDPFPTFVRVPGCNDCSPGAFPPNTHVPGNVPFRVVPDGQGGAFIPWWKDLGNFPNYQAHLAHVSGSAVTDVILPLVFQNTAYLGSQPCPLPYFRPGLPCTTDFRVVIGENGVIFATDLKSVVALDATMAPLWTYSSASGMDLVAATADGGVTINDFQQGLVPLDANGTAGTPSGNSLLAVTPWALGNWMGDPTGALAEFAGPPTDISLSPWFQPEGNRQSQHQPQKPTIAHFVPATPSDLGIESYDAFTGGMTDVDVVPRSKADHVFYMGTKATPEGFLATLANPIAAVGFIGHSFDIFASPPFSVGLNFSTTASALVRPSSPTDNPQYTITAPNTRLVTVSQIHSQAKLIFIGACFSGPAFESLWNLQGGQAMVVLSNPSSTVLLGHALAAWERILEDMVNKHMAAGAAVSETDTFLPRIGVPEQYKVIGDPRVQITP